MQKQSVPLVTVVSYCSRERDFARPLIENARLFSDVVIVCVGTRLYTGEREDVDAEVERLRRDSDEPAKKCAVLVAVYDVLEPMLSEPIALHNLARQTGVAAARRALGFARPFWALLLDGDEVPDGPRFRDWWRGPGGERVRSDPIAAHKLANYWMFLHPQLLAETLEDSVLLVHSDVILNRDSLAHPRERDGIYLWHASSPLGRGQLRVERTVLGDDGSPMFWHFSWVRGFLGLPPDGAGGDGGRAALKAKCANWGHRNDRDWASLIDDAFDAIENGRWPTEDFVHGYPLRLLGSLPSVLNQCTDREHI